MKNIFLTTTLILAFSAAPSFAQNADPDTPEPSLHTPLSASNPLDFSALDTDQNGVVSKSELAASGKTDSNPFSEIDADSDGSISVDELDTWNSPYPSVRESSSDDGEATPSGLNNGGENTGNDTGASGLEPDAPR